MILFIALFVLWLILNGRVTAEICVFGAVFSLLITWFSSAFLKSTDTGRPKHSIRYYLLLMVYLFVLLWEVIRANTQVFRICLARRLSFEPSLVYFNPGLKETSSRVLLANSITLTPGTITVRTSDGRFCVHCLDRSLGEGIEDCRFVRLLRRMEEV